MILFSFCQGEQACPADQPYCHVVQYMAESLILHLEKMGYDHYIALACSAELCGRLHASWPAGAPPPSCAFSSEPSRSAPLAGLDTDWQRYLALSHVAERGYDALLIETDFAFHHDIYPLLRAPPLDAFQIVALKAGHHADSGAIYVRGSKCHQDGAALWVLRDVRTHTCTHTPAQRARPGLHLRSANGRRFNHQPPPPPQVHRRKRVAYEAMEADDKKRDPLGIAGHDQQILTAALRIASSPGGSEHDWRDLHRHVADTEEHRSSPLWGALPPQDDGSLGGPLSEFAWDESEERYGMPDPSCPSADPQECARWARFVDELRFVDAQLASKEICVPRDSHRYREGVPCERVAAGFPWVWQHGNILRFGWRNASAASHLLGMNIGWGDKGTSSGGLSGRLAWLVANGYADERVIPSPPEGKVLVMVRNASSFPHSLHHDACRIPVKVPPSSSRTRSPTSPPLTGPERAPVEGAGHLPRAVARQVPPQDALRGRPAARARARLHPLQLREQVGAAQQREPQRHPRPQGARDARRCAKKRRGAMMDTRV